MTCRQLLSVSVPSTSNKAVMMVAVICACYPLASGKPPRQASRRDDTELCTAGMIADGVVAVLGSGVRPHSVTPTRCYGTVAGLPGPGWSKVVQRIPVRIVTGHGRRSGYIVCAEFAGVIPLSVGKLLRVGRTRDLLACGGREGCPRLKTGSPLFTIKLARTRLGQGNGNSHSGNAHL